MLPKYEEITAKSPGSGSGCGPGQSPAPGTGACACSAPVQDGVATAAPSGCPPSPGGPGLPASSCCAPPPDGLSLDGLPGADCSADAPCCGGPPAPPASAWERPGYALCPFVEEFLDTPAGPVPRVSTRPGWRDLAGTLAVRCGLGRARYCVAPGLYALGRPDPDSPVLVTANYKLTFDILRRAMHGRTAWVLVLDTRGVNVWCAAGKQLFSTREVALRVRAVGLDRVVGHRVLVLPQLSATGVQARTLRRACGFSAVFGPVRATDLPAFLDAGMQASPDMRLVTFTLKERLELIPVEFWLLRRTLGWVLAGLLVLAGFGSWGFSPEALLTRGGSAALALLAGVTAGCALVPAALPWLPGRAFALKGLSAGGAAALAFVAVRWGRLGLAEALGLLAGVLALASYTAMNFTGSTPYTSPSGVEREMRRAMPWQAGAVLAGLALWVGAAFAG